jgi:hypothetical protein
VTEEPLGGGNNTREVVRVGDTVHRARDAGSGFAAQVLAYLESQSRHGTCRQHAKAAIAWASADRALLRQHKALLLSALR